MTINELRTKRSKLWEGTKAFLETHRRDNGTLSAEDDATYVYEYDKAHQDGGQYYQDYDRCVHVLCYLFVLVVKYQFLKETDLVCYIPMSLSPELVPPLSSRAITM